MPLNLGDTFPNFDKGTSDGPMNFYEWAGESWVVFVSHPADFTPVCTTELGALAQLVPEFATRNTKLCAISCDTVEAHQGWIKDIQAREHLSGAFPYPIIEDVDRSLAVKLGMIDEVDKDAAGLPLTCRAVFIIAPDKKLKLSLLYPATTGRNCGEILRVLDSLQLTLYQKVATPVNWQKGGSCMILPSVPQADVPALFPKGHHVEAVPSGKSYLRFTPDPSA